MKKNKISISGDLGSGKTVLAKKIAEHNGYQIISVGGIQRKLAQKYGMDTTTFNKYMETHPEIDLECDRMVSEYGKSEESLILDSRLAWHFVPHSLKIHLICNKVIAAQRIYGDKIRENEKYNNIEETYKSMVERRKSEIIRFKQQYQVDIDDLQNYDVVIDTSFLTPEEVFIKAWEAIEKWQKDEPYRMIWISPKNLLPTKMQDDSPSEIVKFCKISEHFFIIQGHELVSNSLQNNFSLVSATILNTPPHEIVMDEFIIKQWEKKHHFLYLK